MLKLPIFAALTMSMTLKYGYSTAGWWDAVPSRTGHQP